jgi:gliding motility-associated-like protein
MKYAKHIIMLLILLVFSKSVVSQIIDTCKINETRVYRVLNKSIGTQLFFHIENAEILSENPTYSDSVTIKWNIETGLFTLSVYEITNFGCTGEIYNAQILINKTNDFETVLEIPNVFTPNEDEKNDYFLIKANNPPQNYSITIFDRWGSKVFETHNINYSWDGRASGEYCSPGVYYYVIQYQNNGKIETKKGFLHLFR